MSTPLFSILHPTARPQEWSKSYVKWIERATSIQPFEYILCADERWGFTREELRHWYKLCECCNGHDTVRFGGGVFWNTGRKCMVDAVNETARHATGSILIVNSDDMEPPEKWDKLLAEVLCRALFNDIRKELATPDAVRAVGKWDSVIHVSTGYYDGPQASGIQILSRARYERLGYVFYPEYESICADDDFLQHAYHDGVVIDARHLMFPHKHAKVGEWDAVYEHQNREDARRLGRQVLEQRKANGFDK